MIGTSQLINTFSRPCFTDTTDIFKDGSGVALYGLDYDASDAGGASGKFGEAAIFNGSSSNISIPTLGGSFYDNDFSISLWVNLNSLGAVSTAYLFSGAGSRDIFINFNSGDSGGGISARLYDGTIRDVVYSSAVAGNWYHVVFVRSKTNGLNLYVNGISRDTNAFTGNANALSFTSDGIGGRVQDRNTTDGRIDQVRIFNTALTSSQVTQLYQENNSTVGTHLFGCIANYNLDGSAKESMGTTAYDGTETDITYRYDGTPTAVDFGVGGKSNYGTRFNGNGYISGLPTIQNTSGEFSVSMWFNTTVNPSVQHTMLGGIKEQGTNDSVFALKMLNDGYSKLYLRGTDGTLHILADTVDATDGNWHHLVATVSSSSGVFYVDGQQVDSATISNNITVDNLLIGAENNRGTLSPTNYFDGDIDQVRVFSKALSSAEVSKLYGNGAGEIACEYTSTTDIVNYPTGTTPVAYYKLDNSSEDFSTGGNDGTDTNIEYRFGRYGQAAVFNGSSSYIESGISTDILNSDYTISFWGKSTSSTGIFLNTSNGTTPFVRLDFTFNGDLYFYHRNSSNTAHFDASIVSGMDDGNWHHVVITKDNTNVKAYKDGSLVGTITSTSGTYSNSTTFQFGRNNYNTNGAYNFNGDIDQIRIFSTALSASQVTELYNEKPETDTSTFKTVLYTGDGGTQYISNVGIDLETNGGLVWIKNRDASHNHILFDSVRGDGNGNGYYDRIMSNTTDAQQDTITDAISSLDSNGFTVVSAGSGSQVNNTNDDYVAWVWKAGGDAVTGTGTGVTNVSISANTDAGFSIVKFTGVSGSGQTVEHGLNSEPEIYFLKGLDNGTDSWIVCGNSTIFSSPTTNFLRLNTTDSVGSTTAGSVGSNGDDINVAVRTYAGLDTIAYCFHSVSGYSKIGSYTGGGTSDVVVTTGFKPQFIMTKRTDNTGNWIIFDSKRSTSDTDFDNFIYPNLSDAEVPNVDAITVSDTGFTVTRDNAAPNFSGANYIYMAFK